MGQESFLQCLRRHSGQDAVTTIEAAEALEDRAAEAILDAEDAAHEAEKRLRPAARRLRRADFRLMVARIPERTRLEPWLAVLIIGTILALILATPFYLLRADALWLVGAMLLPYAVLYPAMFWLFPKDIRPLTDAARLAEASYDMIHEAVASAADQSRRAIEDAHAARRLRQAVERAIKECGGTVTAGQKAPVQRRA